MLDVNNFSYMQIGLASPEKIRSWSHGEVKKPETINYRTLKPEKEGLFCEKIFGPTKDWECHCGKYKRVRYKGVVCDRCGVEVTRSKVRRERMGHIELAAPVSHIWYFKGIPSRMGLTLDMSPRSLEEVIYFASYVVIDPADTPLEKKQLLSEKEYRAYREKYGNTFKAGMGAEAIRELLKEIDLEKEVRALKDEIQTAQGQRRNRAVKRLEVLEAFRNSGNRPDWMVLDVLPVIPPELRPMVQLDGGRFATSDLNDLYRRVINRNNRLKRLLDLGAPDIIVQNEKRMLQEAVDALIDNGRRGRPVTGPGNRPLKSLSHMLKGKQGRFRQNLLGKRVDYSGRSVIVVGPELKMYQCGLPKEMALELFKPFVMKELVEQGLAHNIKSAKRKVERIQPEVWDVLEEVIREHPVLLNRAPTLHRLGIQAFEPILVEGRAIKLHPLVCTAYNADFDGDQMAVHVPLSAEAQAEARLLMLAAQNILNPKDGKPVVTPSQDMVLGNFYLTIERAGIEGEGKVFRDMNEVLHAYQDKLIHLHTRIAIPVKTINKITFTQEQREALIITTPGKLIFNEIFPENFPYINEPGKKNIQAGVDARFFITDKGIDIPAYIKSLPTTEAIKKKDLGTLIASVFQRFGTTKTAEVMDRLKGVGFHYSTVAGITIAVSDIVDLTEKKEIIDQAELEVEEVTKQFGRGLITEDERYNRVIDIWSTAKDKITERLLKSLAPLNPINMMATSGARGNASNFTQLAGMRGLMANPSGRIIELPIKSNFREGLTVLEYFISTHGARKGLADTALRTADSGYLTRRLVDVAQDVIVREEDCGTDQGVLVRTIADKNEEIEGLYDRIVGRVAFKTVHHPETNEVLVRKNQFIDEAIAEQIIDAGVKELELRSVFTCRTHHGVCRKCYGRNLATGQIVEIGEAVGIIAAQSIGEPGTQLTMRTFHTGGVAGDDITQGLPRIQEIFEARNPKGQAVISEIYGEVTDIREGRERELEIKSDIEDRVYKIPFGSRIKVALGDKIEAGQELTEGSLDPKEVLKIRGIRGVEDYLLQEVQRVYRLQGVEINDKHVEIMVRQMLRKVRIIDAGNTVLLPGSTVEIHDYEEANLKAIEAGGQPAIARPILLGITKASLETDSFLSAASFQETTRVLTDAAIKGKRDELLGLKENVIIGKLIPAGTGMSRYHNLHVKPVGIELSDSMTDDMVATEIK
ncbi:DNA-directed RNA polymerase subunit beta' [Rubeoparvulum massiliense]|uniref:DNA-directed RNA polymerase subunit beta' n=1 Tax=Rubeoparvulum massiliense TaxID=1631346 RepID=UPI00065DBD56|nr:DNA-directed RNA polymerase subunit beta' [Rubeoparvulum massiliense]